MTGNDLRYLIVNLFPTYLYSRLQLALKYLRYYLTASNARGHGIHSPFVFDFIKNVLQDKKQYDAYSKIESMRDMLRSNNDIINVNDFGAGSSLIKTNRRVVKDIANSSLKAKKYAQLLYRMVQFYRPATIVELGTSFGITTCYLSAANENAKVYTCEGSAGIAAIAADVFTRLKIQRVNLVRGDFAVTLPSLLADIGQVDFGFVDGNHRKEPTLQYFHKLLKCSGPATILVFDDIHWSREMEEAWLAIRRDPAVTLTIDLFFIGVVLINPDFKAKQHFVIRF